jgi:hypothetical protein
LSPVAALKAGAEPVKKLKKKRSPGELRNRLLFRINGIADFA